jgi:hypothetical protein
MINNTISIAEYKLKQHFANGETSSLTIQEVADLMDLVCFGIPEIKTKNNSIFFSYSEN